MQFIHTYLTTVTVETCGKPQMPQNQPKAFNLVNRISCGTPAANDIIMGTKRTTFSEVERNYFAGRCGLYRRANSCQHGNKHPPLYNFTEVCFVVTPGTDRYYQSLKQPSLGFTIMDCQHFWGHYSSGTVVFHPKRSNFHQQPHFTQIRIIYQQHYGRCMVSKPVASERRGTRGTFTPRLHRQGDN